MKQVVYYLLVGTRGGEMRARIVMALKKTPQNAHKLAQSLSCDYKTILHHVRLLLKHRVIEKKGSYGAVYFLTDAMDNLYSEFSSIWEQLGNKPEISS